jgi:hypothetical protein
MGQKQAPFKRIWDESRRLSSYGSKAGAFHQAMDGSTGLKLLLQRAPPRALDQLGVQHLGPAVQALHVRVVAATS